MTAFKCKMCGGLLNVQENQSTAECEYCGTMQTLPKLDDERRLNLGLLLAEKKKRKKEELKSCEYLFDDNDNYRRVLQFGTDKIKKELGEYLEYIRTEISDKVTPLLEQAFRYLEEENWESASKCCNKVIDIDPGNCEAYLGLLLVENKKKRKEELKYCEDLFDDSENYKKILQFGDDTIKKELDEYGDYIFNGIRYDGASYLLEEAEKQSNPEIITTSNLNEVKSALKEAEENYIQAAEIFAIISGWKDADNLRLKAENGAAEIPKKLEEMPIAAIYNNAIEISKLSEPDALERAIREFERIKEYKDSSEKIILLEQELEKRKKDEADKLEEQRLHDLYEKEIGPIRKEKEKFETMLQNAQKLSNFWSGERKILYILLIIGILFMGIVKENIGKVGVLPLLVLFILGGGMIMIFIHAFIHDRPIEKQARKDVKELSAKLEDFQEIPSFSEYKNQKIDEGGQQTGM